MSGEIVMDDLYCHENERISPDSTQCHSEQLEREIEILKEEIKSLKEEIFGEGIIEIMGDSIRELKTNVALLKKENDHLRDILSGGVNVTTRRAYLLADAVKSAGPGYITQGQARDILTEDGVRPAAKTAGDAMRKAAKLFGLICTKNMKGEVILAVA